MDGALRLAQARGGRASGSAARGGWLLDTPDPPALRPLLRGMAPDQAAALLPRLFNLCGAAQGMAARLSLGLPVAPDARATLHHEVLRDHLLALCVTLPRALGLRPAGLPEGWARGADIGAALWGGAMPQDLAGWLGSGRGLAPLLLRVTQTFPDRAGTGPALPHAGPETVDAPQPLENSPAARQAMHPLMRQAAALHGRGPLWRVLGRACDAAAAATGHLPPAHLRADGMALVPAARGTYALRLTLVAGRVEGVTRITPTDHMLATGGALRCALRGIPDATRAALLLAIFDPCQPVELRHA